MSETRRAVAAQSRAAGLALVLVLGAVALRIPLLHTHALARPALTWWEILPALVVAESLKIHVGLRRDVHSFTLSDIPLTVGLALVSPGQLVFARLLGGLISLAPRQRGVKLAFNLALYACDTQVAILVVRMLQPTDGNIHTPVGWLALVAGTCVAATVSALCISCVIALTNGLRAVPGVVMLTGILCVPPFALLGVLCLVLTWLQPKALPLLALAVLAVYVTQRGYTTLMQRHERLEQIYDFTREATTLTTQADTASAILRHCRNVLRSRHAYALGTATDMSLWLLHLEGNDLVRIRAEDGDPVIVAALQAIATTGESLHVLRGTSDADHRALLTAVALRETIGVALAPDPQHPAALLVSDREDDTASYSANDITLLSTLAAQAAIAFRNANLVEMLRTEAEERRHDATHDPLTGLPNRQNLTSAIYAALATPDARAAVLLLDIDEFKEVNDTLGHHAGDLILQGVGEHLRSALPEHCLVSRLGGDEFAILAKGIGDSWDALEIGEKIRGAFRREFEVAGVPIVVRPSIGVALAPQHGTDAVTLLQRADVAMYEAKTAQSVIAVYNPASDPYTSERLELLAELRDTLLAGALDVYFQPKARLHDSRIVGAEALVRWNHPVRGFVPPDVFVPLAETAGLMRPLTRHVLDVAVRQCAQWRETYPEFCVAVNMSPHSLYDEHFVNDVRDALDRHNLEPEALVLELTEGTVMRDVERGIETLTRLRAVGVELAVDDFGTGHSSLAALRLLPVQEVKIDKAFVLKAGENPEDAAVVRMVIELGHLLNLRVVAEGVETLRAWEMLRDNHCDHAQGYLLSRPLDVKAFDHLLATARGSEQAAEEKPVLRLIA